MWYSSKATGVFLALTPSGIFSYSWVPPCIIMPSVSICCCPWPTAQLESRLHPPCKRQHFLINGLSSAHRRFMGWIASSSGSLNESILFNICVRVIYSMFRISIPITIYFIGRFFRLRSCWWMFYFFCYLLITHPCSPLILFNHRMLAKRSFHSNYSFLSINCVIHNIYERRFILFGWPFQLNPFAVAWSPRGGC